MLWKLFVFPSDRGLLELTIQVALLKLNLLLKTFIIIAQLWTEVRNRFQKN